MRVSALDPEVLRFIDPEGKGRQYQARAVLNLVGTRLAGYVLKRTGEIDNKRKEGALYQLEYRPPATNSAMASDGPSHPHYPHHLQETGNADDADESPKPSGGKTVCFQCGEPGGDEWDYEGIKIRLHPQCERPWVKAYEASRISAGSSP